MELILENHKATILRFENKIEESNINLTVTQRFSTRVNYLSDHRCTCIYSVDITDVDQVLPFHIQAEIVGYFRYDPDLSQVAIHQEATRLLFPYLKSSVAMLTALAGAPVFNIQNHVVKAEDIVGSTPPIDQNAN